MNKRITYFLGAGASFHACPIWNEQAKAMISLAKLHLPDSITLKEEPNPYYKNDPVNYLLWEIGYFGQKGIQFNTIDTFARKLFINEEWDKLNRLKLAVSVFFTVWQYTNDLVVKVNTQYKEIDYRYINLLATFLEKGAFPYFPNNINFVTWNYDLQIQHAYKLFCNNISWEGIDTSLSFIPEINKKKDLQVCHLNGFHGFYESRNSKCVNIFRNFEDLSVTGILNKIAFLSGSHIQENLTFDSYINYAWESNLELSKIARKQANEILGKTDILVIIGYSFPAFNRTIDKELFASVKNKVEKIYYQDPGADRKFLVDSFDLNPNIVEEIKNKMDQFIIPHNF